MSLPLSADEDLTELTEVGAILTVRRNAALAVAGLVVPVLVAVVVFPWLSRALGPERMGLLGLAWATLEYLTLADVGLGRSTVRTVALRLASGAGVGDVISASLLVQGAIGIVAAGAVAALGGLAVTRYLGAAAPTLGEALALVAPIALNLPFILVNSGARCALEGAGRFGLAAALRIASGMAGILIPAALAGPTRSLALIFFALAGARALLTIGALLLVRRAVPGMRFGWPADWAVLGDLLRFGGWVSVSTIVNPALVYFDRFALGAAVGLAAVGRWTLPYEATTRMLVLPAGVLLSLLPAIAALEARGQRPEAARMAWRASGLIAAIMLLPLLPLAVAGGPILQHWLGTASSDVAPALTILCVGVLVNAAAHPLSAFVQGTGRADVTAGFHLLELVIHLPLAWWLVRQFGVMGAASAWTIRVTLDAVLLGMATVRLRRDDPLP